MKTLFMLLCPLLLGFGGDSNSVSNLAADLPTFQAVVLTLSEDTALVEAQSGGYVRIGDQFTFSVRNLPSAGVREGDVVLLTYTGNVQETWPAQIEVTAWRVLASGTPTVPLKGLTPPSLSLRYGGQSLSLPGSIDTWTYAEEDGTYATVVSCRTHPLDRTDGYPSFSRTDDGYVSLSFSTQPDTVAIRCWSAALVGTQEGNYDQHVVSLNWDGSGFSLPKGTEGLVLEIMASWKEEESGASFGSAVYLFTLSPAA